MATITERLAFLISANADQAVKAFEKTANVADRELGKASNRLDVLAGNMTRFGARGLAVAGTLSTGLFKMAQSAAADQKAQAMLARQLEQTTGATKEQIKTIEGYIDATARATGVTDDQLRPAFSQLTRAMGSTQKAQQALNLALDISAATGRDLSSITMALSRAAMGQTTSLRRLGVPLSEAAVKSKNLDVIMGELSRTFAGQAAVAADTLAGRMARARVAITEASEKLGATFAPVITNVATAVGKGAQSLQSLDSATGGAVAKFTTFGVLGLGVVSALSLVGGQVLKVRDRFTTLGEDGTRSLNGLGRAAQLTGAAVAGIAVSEAVFASINAATDSLGKVDRAAQALNITLSRTDASKTVGAFRDLVRQTDDVLRFSNIWADFGKKITIVGGQNNRTIENIDRAFTKILQESGPQAAQSLLIAWRQETAGLQASSDQYRDNMMLIDRYQKRIDLLVGSTNALVNIGKQGAGPMGMLSPESYALLQAMSHQFDDTTKSVGRTDDSIKQLRSTIRDQFRTALRDANDELKTARQRFADYRDSVASSITGMLSLQAAIENRPQGVGIIDALGQQVTKISEFATRLQTLIGQKLSKSGLSYILSAGYEAGTQIVGELINGGQAAVDQFNAITSSLESSAAALGTNAAGAFYQSGVDMATELVRGINETISKYRLKIKGGDLTAAGLRNLRKQLAGEIAFEFSQFDTASIAPAQVVQPRQAATMSVSAASVAAVPNVNVYVQGADPNAVVDALRTYMFRNGAVPIRIASV